MKTIIITCALLVMAATQVWSQYTYCFPYGKGRFEDIAFVNRDSGMAVGYLALQKDSTFFQACILRTTNSGVSWDTTALPPSIGREKRPAEVDDYSRLLLHRNGTGLLFSRFALYTTGDFGRTWDVLSYDDSTRTGFFFLNGQWPSFTPQLLDDSLVYANISGGVRGILRSSDLGRTWSEIADPESTTRGTYGMSFENATHGWILKNSLWETTDGCATFHRRSSTFYSSWIQCLNDSILIRNASEKFYFSSDSGSTWTEHSISKMQRRCTVVVFVDTNRLCFGQDEELGASKDGGKSVHITTLNPGDQAFSMCIADSNTIFAATLMGIIRITNGGFPDTTTSVSADDGSPPFVWSITPNPSHHEADVHITVREPQNVRLTIVTTDGRIVIDRELGVVQPGTITEHLVLPSGAYLCTCTVGAHRQTTPISITR